MNVVDVVSLEVYLDPQNLITARSYAHVSSSSGIDSHAGQILSPVDATISAVR